jgi:signal transduction histidine kinase
VERGVKQHRAVFSWLFVCALFVLCVVLGILQYRWITEVSLTARDRLREGLQHSLTRLGQDFDSEIASSCAALTPSDLDGGPQILQNEVAERYTQWKKTNRHGRMFDRIAIAIPQGNGIELRTLDLDSGVLQTVAWPPGWDAMKGRLEANLYAGDRPDRGSEPGSDRQPPRRPPPRSGGRGAGGRRSGDGLLFEEPLFSSNSGHPRPGPPDRGEIGWLIFELNLAYLRDVMLPEVLQRDLGTASGLDYQVEVVTNSDPAAVIYQSGLEQFQDIAATADASISLFELQSAPGSRRGGGGPPGMRGPGYGPGGRGDHGPGPAPDIKRWRMYVRHRAGSLETVVAQSRLRSLAVTGGVLLLMLATAAALLRYTRRAQRLADLQMDFVAGVSHELRTPLSVIHTAAYNLQGKMANNPAQVEKYGALIQRESGRLGELVEQVLQFAGAHSGRAIQEREPLSVESVIDQTMEAHREVIDGCHCVVVKAVDPGLPPVLGDSRALGQVIGNLLCNAAKYGVYGSTSGSNQSGNWIGIFASKAAGDQPAAVEIRVSDRGPGIPAHEQEHIFDPFFRGSRAVQDQIHGTGLGLSLVKKIVEAHGGNIRVKSEPMKGAEFIVWLPAAPAGVVG